MLMYARYSIQVHGKLQDSVLEEKCAAPIPRQARLAAKYVIGSAPAWVVDLG